LDLQQLRPLERWNSNRLSRIGCGEIAEGVGEGGRWSISLQPLTLTCKRGGRVSVRTWTSNTLDCWSIESPTRYFRSTSARVRRVLGRGSVSLTRYYRHRVALITCGRHMPAHSRCPNIGGPVLSSTRRTGPGRPTNPGLRIGKGAAKSGERGAIRSYQLDAK